MARMKGSHSQRSNISGDCMEKKSTATMLAKIMSFVGSFGPVRVTLRKAVAMVMATPTSMKIPPPYQSRSGRL